MEIDIGDWDMDADITVAVAHGLSATEWKTVRSLIAVVRNDADTLYFLLYTQAVAAGVAYIDVTNVNLFRDAGGEFDGTDFDATTYNRGWIFLTYTPD